MKLHLALAFSLAFAPPLVSLDVYEYENTRGSETYLSVISIAPSGEGYRVHVELDFQTIDATLGRDHVNETLRYVFFREKIDLVVVREGNSARITGTFRGVDVAKTCALDDAPWCQFIELNFNRFIMSEDRTFRYWVFAGPRNEMVKMEMRKEKIETIDINGTDERAWHVVTAPMGIYSLFWHADFWFRASDGMYLQYSAIEGFGAPVTVTRFKRRASIDGRIAVPPGPSARTKEK